MFSDHRILIVSQTFPPYNGIGGRRWAKFAKYLRTFGARVEVICADLKTNKKSPWTDDVKDIDRYTYNHQFPRVVEQFPKNTLEKIIYRLQLAKLRKISKGTPYDRALLDEHSFKEIYQNRLSEFKPQTVIVTGAPFYLLSYAIDVISDFPDTKFIADFRDPWTWGASYGYSELSDERLNYENSLEDLVVNKYHAILSPWPSIVQNLKLKYPLNSPKIHLLEHGYDPDDFKASDVPGSAKGYDLIFGGTIYKGTNKILEDVIFQSNGNFSLGVFSNDLSNLTIPENNSHLSNLIESKEYFARVSESTSVLMLIPEHMKDGIPSKLFEYASLGRPIIALGHRGSLSEFIEANDFGLFLDDVTELAKTIHTLPQFKRNDEVLLNYNFEQLTKKLLSFLNTV